MAASGFWYWLGKPRAALHHSCAACEIVAAPGVIISAIPAGIFAVPVTCKVASNVRLDFATSWAQVEFAWTYRGHKRDACASVVLR